jgi:hypothetical protein
VNPVTDPLRALLVVVLAASACRFERRPDLPNEAGPTPSVNTVGNTVEDSVRALASAIDEALGVGDVSRMANLTVPMATLIDQEEAVRWTRDDPTTPLPRVLHGGADGLDWLPGGSRFVDLGDSALLINDYNASVRSGGGDWRAVETLILVRTPTGWRLLHLHRSRGRETGEL